MDSVTSDLGYITNSGISRKQKNHDPATDDMFRVEVGIQMADMDETDGATDHKIYFAVKFGEIIVVGESKMQLPTLKMLITTITFTCDCSQPSKSADEAHEGSQEHRERGHHHQRVAEQRQQDLRHEVNIDPITQQEPTL